MTVASIGRMEEAWGTTPARTHPAAARAPRASGAISVEFAATILRPLVETMLPASEAAFGSGMAGSTWRGMFADALAREMAERETFGLSELLPQETGSAS